MIPLLAPSHNKKAILKELEKTLSTIWLGQGPKAKAFEEKFGQKFGFKYCVAVNSGTSALELAYHLLDIKEGDEVISTVLTCTATNIPILRRKAKVVFCDIEKDTLNADPLDIERKITKKTKAIVVTSLGGNPVNEKVFRIAKRRKIPVVVDACQALGVTEKRGNYVTFSFQAVKMWSTGDGGILILRNKKEYNRAKLLRWFGISREKKLKSGWQSYKLRLMTLVSKELGYKYHMNDVAASFGLVGLKENDKLLDYRKKIAKFYRKNIDYPCIAGGSYWLFAILVDDRDELSKYLYEHGIDTNLVHIRNDLNGIFGGKRLNLPNMNEIEEKYLYIPLHTRLSMTDTKYIVKTIKEFQGKDR